MPATIRMATVLACLLAAGLFTSVWSAENGAEIISPPHGLPGPASAPTNLRAASQPVPSPPGTKSPVDTFRELLAMNPSERAQALASKSEYHRKYLEGRLREYESLEPSEREVRLTHLELEWHLRILMSLSPTNRLPRLDLVPARLRPVIDDRLKDWDRLSPTDQKDVLDHETTASYFLRVKPAATSRQDDRTRPVSLSEADQRGKKMIETFFEMPPKEREKTLEVLPDSEREEMEQSFQGFAKLLPAERQACIDSFAKLRSMSKEQRNRFLECAERWKAMSPRERELWQTLVKSLPPNPAAPIMPPIPTGAGLSKNSASASNQAVPRQGP